MYGNLYIAHCMHISHQLFNILYQDHLKSSCFTHPQYNIAIDETTLYQKMNKSACRERYKQPDKGEVPCNKVRKMSLVENLAECDHQLYSCMLHSQQRGIKNIIKIDTLAYHCYTLTYTCTSLLHTNTQSYTCKVRGCTYK